MLTWLFSGFRHLSLRKHGRVKRPAEPLSASSLSCSTVLSSLGTLDRTPVLDKGSVDFEFPPVLLAGRRHVTSSRARSLAGRLPWPAAMFKSNLAGTWPTRPDRANVFINCAQVLAYYTTSRGCLVTKQVLLESQKIWAKFDIGFECRSQIWEVWWVFKD